MNKYKLLEILNKKAGGEFRNEVVEYYKNEISKKIDTINNNYVNSNDIELLDALLNKLDAVIVELEEVKNDATN